LDAATGSLVWKFAKNNNHFFTDSFPTVTEGKVYVVEDDGIVYALDGLTGSLVWSDYISLEPNQSVAVARGVVYVGTGEGELWALDADNGAEVWAGVPAPHELIYSTRVANGVVYAAGSASAVYILDARNGTLLSTLTPRGPLNHSSAVVVDGNVYIGSDNGSLFAYGLGK
jgi:outer membrane protein assembly factor BamB